MINRIKNFFVSRDHIKQYNRQTEMRLKYFVRSEYLKNCIYNSTKSGISETKYCEHEVIVSLTTFGKRLYDVATTIESIMQGSMLPNRIVLWLGEEHKNEELPISLQLQQERGLQVEYCKDIRSYTKLIPSLKKYPDEVIITIDDDLVYERDLVENLFRTYKKNPTCICANRIHKIRLDDKGMPLMYNDWEYCSPAKEVSPLNFLTGVGGVLYPPHCLDEEVYNEGVFLDICKYADDIWFYAMAKKKGTDIIKSFTHNSKGQDFFVNIEVQDVGLRNINKRGENLNDKQLRNVFERYNLFTIFQKD